MQRIEDESSNEREKTQKLNNSVYTAFGNLLSSIPGGVIQFELDEDKSVVLITDKTLRLLGCNRDGFEREYQNKFENVIYVEDRYYVEDLINEGIKKRSNVEAECRLVTYSGNHKWVAISIQIIYAEDKPVQGYAIVMDIDAYKQNELILEQENDRYKQMLNMNSDIFFEYDIDKDTIIFNSVDSIFSSGNQQMVKFSNRLIKSKKIVEEDKADMLALKDIEDRAEVEFRFKSVDGSVMWCKVKAVAVYNSKINKKTLIGWINNIDKVKKEKEYQQEKTKRDSLTMLYNSEYASKYINEFLDNEKVENNNFHALIILDIDNFKNVNNCLGNIFGDAVLANIADNLQKLLYKSDIVGRVGGDEFVIFIKKLSDISLLIEKMEEIRNVINGTYVGEELSKKMTCSMGVAIYPENGENLDELFDCADSALYQAKLLGGDRYVFYDDVHLDEFDIVKDKNENKKFYNEYKIDSIRKQSVNLINREITTFAFDIMAKTKDISSAINLILDKIGKQLDATFVNIAELVDDEIDVTFAWNSQGGMKRTNNTSFLMDNNFASIHTDRFDERGLYVIDNVFELDDDDIQKSVYQEKSIKAAMRCMIMDGEEIEGFVNVFDCQKTRDWTKDEQDSVVTIAKIISSYLVKLRTSQRMEERLNEVKNYDVLTAIPTLYKFKNDVKKVFKEGPKKEYVIVSMDFYNFKYINDTYGYDLGDNLLRYFARHIEDDFKNTLACCRVSSDNFILLSEFTGEEDIQSDIEVMIEEFRIIAKQNVLNQNIRINAGAAVVESLSGDVMVPIDNANIARKFAKENAMEKCYFFSEEMKERIRLEFEITNTMETALAHNEFKVFLQPKVKLSNGTLAGAEALVRWIRPDKGIMPPDKFIPLFEKNGFVVNLDFFVYEEVCKMLREWIDRDMNPVPISVNVSRVHLYDKGFVDDFVELINKYNIPNDLIELELTESIFLDNTEMAITTMRRFRSLGFKVSIDDFGAGYSSLNLLKEMTSDVLKLDKEFFGKGELQKEEKIIVSSIVNMAKQLNMTVLSEGVETESQSDFLRNIECDLAQGYLFAKPMPRESFEVIMSNNLVFMR